MKTPERRQWHRSGVFIVNFEQISHLLQLFLLLSLSRKIPTVVQKTDNPSYGFRKVL